jgi:hypothetical protein
MSYSYGNQPFKFARRNDYGFSPRGQFFDQRVRHNNIYRNSVNTGQSTNKHSGAKSGRGRNDKPYISAWNYSRRNGLVSVFIAPYHGTYKSGLFSDGIAWKESKAGRRYQVWMCKIEGKGIASDHFPVLVNEQGTKAVIRKFGWVVNAGARNGGYCGTFTKK